MVKASGIVWTKRKIAKILYIAQGHLKELFQIFLYRKKYTQYVYSCVHRLGLGTIAKQTQRKLVSRKLLSVAND